MNVREEEMAFTIDMITKICNETKIALYPKKVKGNYIMIIQDTETGKEYALTK